jgi:hypothetical protein
VINVGYPTASNHNINIQENISSVHMGLRRMIQHTGKLFDFHLINEALTDVQMRLYKTTPMFRPLFKTPLKLLLVYIFKAQ